MSTSPASEPSDELVFKAPVPPPGTGLRTFERVCAAAELAYQKGGKALPSVKEIAETAGLNAATTSKIVNTTHFKHEMSLRGIKWSATGRFTQGLTPEQVYLLGIITDPTNKKPLAEKLRVAGVSYSTYRNWVKQPAFSQALLKFGEDLFGENMSTIHTKLTERASAGDMAAIKLFYEVSGRHDPARQQTVDIMRIIGLILESVTRRISDPVVLAGIQEDLDIIASGGAPVDDGSMPNNYVPSPAMLEGKVVAHHDTGADSRNNSGSHLDRSSAQGDSPDLSPKEQEIADWLKANGLNPEDYS